MDVHHINTNMFVYKYVDVCLYLRIWILTIYNMCMVGS